MNLNERFGAAFPFAATDPSNVELQTTGMSLRDWFAGQALAGVIAKMEGNAPSFKEVGNLAAKVCYSISDAMLEARK